MPAPTLRAYQRKIVAAPLLEDANARRNSRNNALKLGRDLRQMNRTPERLLHEIESIDENADAGQPAGLELRELGEPQADRLVDVQRGQRIAHHRGRGIHTQHDRLAIEAVDPYVVRDLPDDLEHGGLAAA